MTPKEKAKELMQKAYDLDKFNKTTRSRCKQIALLCVNEIITCQHFHWSRTNEGYWKEVVKEINTLT